MITAAEWSRLERGVIQRVRALEAFLADIYGYQQIVADGVLPRRLITSCEHFHRQAAGIAPPNGVRIHVAGIDVVRDELGLTEEQMAASRRTLAEHGNCSSVTVLLVLEEMADVDGPVVVMAFGPGLTLYAALLLPA